MRWLWALGLASALLLVPVSGCLDGDGFDPFGSSTVDATHLGVGSTELDSWSDWTTEIWLEADGFGTTGARQAPVDSTPTRVMLDPRLEAGQVTVEIADRNDRTVFETTVNSSSSRVDTRVAGPTGMWTVRFDGSGANGNVTVRFEDVDEEFPPPFAWEANLVADSMTRTWTWESPGIALLTVNANITQGEAHVVVLGENGTKAGERTLEARSIGAGGAPAVAPSGEWEVQLETQMVTGTVNITLEAR